jgi:hypothetical protein
MVAQKLQKKIEIVETYWHDHSLESAWGAPSDGTISFLIQPFWGKMYFLNCSRKTSVLYSLRTDCGDFCYQGQDTEIAKKIKIVETYWHDHS